MRTRPSRALALLLVVCLGLAACAADDSSEPDDPPTTDEEAGEPDEPDDPPTTEAPDDDEDEDEDEEASLDLDIDEIAPLVIEDLEIYWTETMAEVYGLEYEPVEGGFFPYDAEHPPPPCGGFGGDYESNAFNAFYCVPDDFVAWDTEQLWPTLAEDFGDFAIAMVMAHEWGHAVQARTGLFGTVPTIVTELQADCFAGGWAARLYEGGSDLLSMDDTAFGQAIGGLVLVRDAPGTAADDPTAHGSAFDRIGAFQEGFTEGPERCATYDVDLPPPLDLQFIDATDYELGGDLPIEDLIELAVADLNAYVQAVEPSFEPIDGVVLYEVGADDVPSCDGDLDDPDDQAERVLLCFDENIVAADAEYLLRLHTEIGDAATAALLAREWGTALQFQTDTVSEDPLETVSVSVCLTGAWAADIASRDPATVPAGFISGLSPGDLDEMILAYASFVDADAPEQGIIPFLLVGELRRGFFEGPGSC